MFTLTYATWAAKSERAGKLLVPILDILQSVPILGFISITVVFFMSLAPGRVLGAEFAAIFAIFTSQAWNMAFSFYQSLRTVPTELMEAADSFHLSPWMRFWQLEVPFGMPALIWNMMMSMSGGWFFVVASESISVGHTTVALPGIGSYIALAIEQRNLHAIGWAIATMLIVILLYDQLLFRPLVAWVDRFRVEQEPGVRVPDSWALTMMRRSRLIQAATRGLSRRRVLDQPGGEAHRQAVRRGAGARSAAWICLWVSLIVAAVVLGLWHIVAVLIANTPLQRGLAGVRTGDAHHAARVRTDRAGEPDLGADRRVGRHAAARGADRAADGAVPGGISGQSAVSDRGVRHRDLEAQSRIWLSPLMILGTQWYILFNVIAGASAIPAELRYAAANFGVSGWLWWRKVALPAVLPYYVTGAITASGGSWNAAIVAELASWGNTQVRPTASAPISPRPPPPVTSIASCSASPP